MSENKITITQTNVELQELIEITANLKGESGGGGQIEDLTALLDEQDEIITKLEEKINVLSVGNLNIPNAVEYTNLYALERIEKNNFIKHNPPGISNIIGTAEVGASSDYDCKLCYIGDNTYVICASAYTQAFRYENDTITLGIKTSTIGGDNVTEPVADPYGFGCFYVAGSSDHGYFRVNYIEVNKDTLVITPISLTLGESRVYGGGTSHFIDENHIYFLTHDNYQGVLTLDRINKKLTLLSKSSAYGGNSIQVADKIYLTYYSGGNAESWYLRLIKINSDYSLTAGTEYLMSATDSGIHFANNIIKTNNNNIYVPIGNGLLYKINCNTSNLSISWTITSTQLPNYSYYDQNHIFITDSEDIFFIGSTQNYINSSQSNITDTIIRLKENNNTLELVSSFTNTTAANAFYTNHTLAYTGSGYLPLVMNYTSIHKYTLIDGYIHCQAGDSIDGVANNSINAGLGLKMLST